MQDPFFGMVKLWADGREMIANTIRKNEKPGEQCSLFGWNDRHEVVPDGLVRGAVFLPVS